MAIAGFKSELTGRPDCGTATWRPSREFALASTTPTQRLRAEARAPAEHLSAPRRPRVDRRRDREGYRGHRAALLHDQPRNGRIDSPGYEKMRAIAKAMGFPPEAWFDDTPSRAVARVESQDIARSVEHLFEAVRNPKTDKPYTNAQIARMSLGDLSRESIEGIRTGAIGEPTVGQASALASVFGVKPSSLLDRGEPLFDEDLVEALRNRMVREATR